MSDDKNKENGNFNYAISDNYENEYANEDCDDYCDLDRTKICDNCGKCIESDKNYKIIKITKIIQ